MTGIKKIGTHNGRFHCDEALACFMLKTLPEFKEAEIIRTRDMEILNKCDIVVDVGGVYNPQTHRYDHHQRSFDLTMNKLDKTKPWDIKLSSAGLIYHHFARRIFEAILNKKIEEDVFHVLFNYVYKNFVLEIDGIDNGIPMFDGEPKYSITTGLSSRVGNLQPSWNERKGYVEDEGFKSAMALTGSEFTDRIEYFVNSWWPARSLVRDAVENRFKVHESGEIIELTTQCPWKEHLFDIEESNGISNTVKFVLFEDHPGDCRVQAVPVRPDSFLLRVCLDESWQGMRDDELCQVTGISGCRFVHQTGFIGGNLSRDGCKAMAVKSLELHHLKNGSS